MANQRGGCKQTYQLAIYDPRDVATGWMEGFHEGGNNQGHLLCKLFMFTYSFAYLTVSSQIPSNVGAL
jgi:hypothetical protein